MNAGPRPTDRLHLGRAMRVTRHAEVQMLLRHPAAEAIPEHQTIARLAAAAGRDYRSLIALASGTLLFLNGPDHGGQRGLSLQLLRRVAPGLSEARMTDCIQAALSAAGDGGRVEAVSTLCLPPAVALMAGALGLSDATAALILRDGLRMFESWQGSLSLRACDQNQHLADAILTALRADMAEDNPDRSAVLADLVALARDQGEAPDRLAARLFFLFVAGIATTPSLLASILLRLAQGPALQERLRTDPALVTDFVEEVLRTAPPLRLILRRLTAPVMLNETWLEPGQVLLLDLEAAQRDPETFRDGETFDPGRKDRAPPLAFGTGPHTCLGAPLARSVGRIFVTEVLRRYRVAPADPAPEWDSTPGVCRLQSLQLHLFALT